MAKSRRSNSQKKKFFAAVTINCKTAVKSSEKALGKEIAKWGVTKKNVAVFECCFNGTNTNKELIRKRRFLFMARHRTALKNACTDFLKDGMEA